MVYERAASSLSIQETGSTVMNRGDPHEEDFFFFAGAVQRTLRVCGLHSSEMTLFIMSSAQQDVKESAIHRALRKADSVTLH